MSTPVSQLPNMKPPAGTPQIPDDPDVLNVLSELEQEVVTATAQQQPQPVHAVPVQQVPMPPVYQVQPNMPAPPGHVAVKIPNMQMMKNAKKPGLWNVKLAQKAGIIAIIAMVIFFPKTMQAIYALAPKFETMFATYDMVIRTLVFAVIIYIVMLKVLV